MELLEFWRSIVKRKWIILLLGCLVAGLTAIISFAMTPTFSSTATLLIEAGKGKIVSIEEVYSVAQQREHYQTQLEIIKSRDVALRTVKALRLWESQQFDPRKAAPSLRQQFMTALGFSDAAPENSQTEAQLADSAAKALMQIVTVSPVRMSQLVRVQVTHEDRALAASLANAVAQQYIESERDERYQLTQQVSQQLQERLAALREKLSASERALQDYREQRGIVALGGSAQVVSGQALAETIKSLSEAQSRRATLEGEYQQAQQAGADFSSIPTVARSPLVAESQRNLSAAQTKLADMLYTLGPAHMRVQQAQAEVEELRATLGRHQLAAVAVLKREYEAARNTEQTLTSFLGSARGAAQNVNRQEFELAVLERDYQSNKQLYEVFMSRAKETNLMGDLQPTVARIVDKAVPGTVPVAPKKAQMVIVALVLSLLLGCIASIVLDRLDNTIKGTDDAENRLKLPVLAALPMVADHNRPKMARLFLDESHSHFAEGIRTARTGVMLSSLDVPHKTLLVTSTLPGEGKTTVSINLALAHAQTKRTLLIDGDMRRSQAGRALGLAAGAKGMTNLVAGTATVEECISQVEGSPLWVLGVGDIPPNPLDLLLSQRFKDVLTELQAQFEMIVIDSPPVELVSEALVLAPLCTSTTLVVKAMGTPAPLVRKSLTRLQRSGAHMLGVIVNQLDFNRAQKYYGEYGSSTYNYGSYGYGPQVQGKAGGAAGKKALPPVA